MKKRSIYQNRSQELYSLFQDAGNNSKIMFIPIDYVKKCHVLIFCRSVVMLCSDVLLDKKLALIL